MSLPQRPQPSSPRRDDRHSVRDSPRRRRPSDLENTRTHDRDRAHDPAHDPAHERTHRRTRSGTGAARHTHHPRQLPSPGTPVPMERDPVMAGSRASPAPAAGQDLGRKRSLIRPERQRFDQNHPNYHYRQHAQKMNVYPSTTGNDPIMEDRMEAETVSSDSTDLKPPHLRNESTGYTDKQAPLDDGASPLPRRLTRSKTMDKREKQRQKEIGRASCRERVF